MNLEAALPILLPRAIAWAEMEADRAAKIGQALSSAAVDIALRVGVAHPDRICVLIDDAMPMPEDRELQAAAVQTGLLGPHMAGLTLGYSVFVRRGHDTWQLLSHEFRHVAQYERAGSIADFLPIYLRQIVEAGYFNAPLEKDAREHEIDTP